MSEQLNAVHHHHVSAAHKSTPAAHHGHSKSAPIDTEAAAVNAKYDLLEEILDEKYGASAVKAAGVDAAIHAVRNALNAAAKASDKDPFYFDDSIKFTFSNAIMALGKAISELLASQPGIIASDMGISNGLVSDQVNGWSTCWLGKLKSDEKAISDYAAAGGKDGATIASLQGQLSVDNAASTASSTGLNGVMSMITQDVSTKTSSYQNLVQQANQVVTALLAFMSQLWVI